MDHATLLRKVCNVSVLLLIEAELVKMDVVSIFREEKRGGEFVSVCYLQYMLKISGLLLKCEVYELSGNAWLSTFCNE